MVWGFEGGGCTELGRSLWGVVQSFWGCMESGQGVLWGRRWWL